jgi:hypothetical protein
MQITKNLFSQQNQVSLKDSIYMKDPPKAHYQQMPTLPQLISQYPQTPLTPVQTQNPPPKASFSRAAIPNEDAHSPQLKTANHRAHSPPPSNSIPINIPVQSPTSFRPSSPKDNQPTHFVIGSARRTTNPQPYQPSELTNAQSGLQGTHHASLPENNPSPFFYGNERRPTNAKSALSVSTAIENRNHEPKVMSPQSSQMALKMAAKQPVNFQSSTKAQANSIQQTLKESESSPKGHRPPAVKQTPTSILTYSLAKDPNQPAPFNPENQHVMENKWKKAFTGGQIFGGDEVWKVVVQQNI